MWLITVCNVDFRALRYTYHFLECTFYGPNNQALMWDLLLSEEACWRGAGRARGPHTTTQGGRSRQCPGVGGRVVRLLSQAGGREDGHVPQDVHDLLQLLQDMVLQQFGSDHSCSWPSVSIKQGPVVQVDPICVLEKQRRRKGRKRDGHCYIAMSEMMEQSVAQEQQIKHRKVSQRYPSFWNGRNTHCVSTALQEGEMLIFATHSPPLLFNFLFPLIP